MTGEHAFAVAITNNGNGLCWLSGYPRITLVDAAGRTLPFSYQDGGSYVTSAAPAVVPLAPGQEATVLFAKYRCDLGDRATATAAEIELPGVGRLFTVRSGDGRGVEAYCGPGDPGDYVVVSPIEPNLVAAIFDPPPMSPPSSALPTPSASK